MDVSIIILNYNTFELTCSCISSVIQCTQGINYEIILVDNASTECPADLFSDKFPSIKLIKNTVNSGFTGGNNLGIKNAAGDYILLLNSDTVLTENSILKCYLLLKNHSDIGVISCVLKYPDGNIQKQCQRFPSILLTLIELLRIHKLISQPARGKFMQNGFFDHRSSIYCDSVWGAFFMFPAKILDMLEEHQLPGEFFMYAEDLLWCYLIKKMGHKVYYTADTSIIHLMGGSFSPSILQQKHQNEYAFIVKYYGWMYAKILVLLRALLYSTSHDKSYAKDITRVYRNLLINGKTI